MRKLQRKERKAINYSGYIVKKFKKMSGLELGLIWAMFNAGHHMYLNVHLATKRAPPLCLKIIYIPEKKLN